MLCFLNCTSGTLLSGPKMQRCAPEAFLVVLYGRPLDITSNNGDTASKISSAKVCQRLRYIATFAKGTRNSRLLFFSLGKLELGHSNFLLAL